MLKQANAINKNLFEIDYVKLYNLAENLKDKYQNATPFPNCVIDDFLPPITYQNICETFPNPESEIWKAPNNVHTLNKFVTKQGLLGLKEYLFTENQRRIFMELNSSLFINFLEKITGIIGLIPDPYFSEGSYAMSKKDGMLDIHADFSHHDKIGLERRVNILYYLNNDWKEEYEGALNLYDENLIIKKKIYPIGNRITIFTTSEISFHGFPERIKCPENMYRKSINLYYYTIPRKEREVRRILFPTDLKFIPNITNN
jgi:Rps23 Pro-64 3,4-dihydroxylase Tpa1-like proline 4-hydroxylase